MGRNFSVTTTTNTADAPLTDVTDESLVVQAQAGSEAAFQTLIERYMKKAYTIAYQIVWNHEDARDLSQDVFIKIYQAIDRFDSKKRFFSWFYRILLNHCLNFRRKRAWLSPFSNEDLDRMAPAFPGESSGDCLLRQVVQRAVRRLSGAQQRVVILCDMEGFSQQEAAEILRVPEGTVRSRLHYARRRLKELLAPQLQSGYETTGL